MTIEKATRHFRVTGRVQGVGFRYRTQQEARRLGLVGWVRNNPDSSVEASAMGSGESLDALERWLQNGPAGARVDTLESCVPDAQEPSAALSGSDDFVIVR